MSNSNSFEKISDFSREQRDIIQEKIQSRMKELSSERKANQELIAQKVNSLIALISNVIDEVSVSEFNLLQNLLDYTERDPIWKKTKEQSNQSIYDQPHDISFRSSILNNISEIQENSQEEIPITDVRSRILQPSKRVEQAKLTPQEREKLEQLLLKKLDKQNSPINTVKKKIFNFVIEFFSTQELIQLDWNQTLTYLQSSPYITSETEPKDGIIYLEYFERSDPTRKLYVTCNLSQVDKFREWLNLKDLKQIVIPQQFTRFQEHKVIQIEGQSSRQIVNQIILALSTSLEQVPGRSTKFYGHYVMPKASKDQLLEFQQNIYGRSFDQVIEFYNQYFNQLSRIIGNPYTLVIANSINPYSKRFIISISGEIILESGKGRYIDTLTQTDQKFYVEQFNQEGYDITLYPMKSGISAMMKNNLYLESSCQFIRFNTKMWIENKTSYQINISRLEIEVNL